MAFSVENQSCPKRPATHVSNTNKTIVNNNNCNSSANNNINTNTIGIPRDFNIQDRGASSSKCLHYTGSKSKNKNRQASILYGDIGDRKCIENDSDYNSEIEFEFESESENLYNNKQGCERIKSSSKPKSTKPTTTTTSGAGGAAAAQPKSGAAIKIQQGNNKNESTALFTKPASYTVFSEKEPISSGREEPKCNNQSKLVGIKYGEYIDRQALSQLIYKILLELEFKQQQLQQQEGRQYNISPNTNKNKPASDISNDGWDTIVDRCRPISSGYEWSSTNCYIS